MWLCSQCAQDEDVEVLQFFDGFLRHAAQVGAPCDVSDSVADGEVMIVRLEDGGDGVVEEGKLAVLWVEGCEVKLGDVQPVFEMVAAGVAENLFQAFLVYIRDINVDHLALKLVESTEIIHPHDMVGMGVGYQARINLANIVLKALNAKFWSSVNQYITAINTNKPTGAGTSVARVVAGANRAITGDHGNALAGAGT